MRRPSPRAILESLRWRLTLLRWQAVGHAAKAALVLAAVGAAVLVALWPRWTLEYLDVVAWPAVVLIGLVLFRHTITGLFADADIEHVGVGPASARFRPRAEQRDLLRLLEDTGAAVGTLQADLDQHKEWLNEAGVLLELFEIQLDFLRHLRADGTAVTGAAAEDWFTKQLQAQLAGGTGINVPALVGFTVERAVVQMSGDGTYTLTPKGHGVLSLADNFWYAPKVG